MRFVPEIERRVGLYGKCNQILACSTNACRKRVDLNHGMFTTSFSRKRKMVRTRRWCRSPFNCRRIAPSIEWVVDSGRRVLKRFSPSTSANWFITKMRQKCSRLRLHLHLFHTLSKTTRLVVRRIALCSKSRRCWLESLKKRLRP